MKLGNIIFQVTWFNSDIGRIIDKFFKEEADAWELYHKMMALDDNPAVMLKVHSLDIEGDPIDIAINLLNRTRFLGHTENLANNTGVLRGLPWWAKNELTS